MHDLHVAEQGNCSSVEHTLSLVASESYGASKLLFQAKSVTANSFAEIWLKSDSKSV